MDREFPVEYGIAATWVIDGTGREAMEHTVVFVDGAKIVDVCPKLTASQTSVPVYPFPGMTLLPGLIDAHVHITASPDVHDWIEDSLDCSDARLLLRAATNARRALAAGVTTMRDLGGKDDLVFEVKQALADGVISGPRLLVAGRPLTCPRGHMYFMGGEVASRPQMARLIADQAARGAEVVKAVASGGGMTPGTGLLQRQFSRADLAFMIDESHRRRLPVSAHVTPTPLIRELADLSVDTIEHCTLLTGDGIVVNMAVLERIKQAGSFVVPTRYQFYLTRNRPETSGGLKLEVRTTHADLYDRSIEFLQACRALNIPIAAGSDAGIPNVEFNHVIGELEMMASCGYAPIEAVASATGTGADALGIGAERGRIRRGLHADLLIVEGPVHQNISNLRQPRLVIQDGRVVVDQRDLAQRSKQSELNS